MTVFKEGIAKFLKIDQIMERLSDYVESRIEIVKYDIQEEASKVLSKASVYLVLLFLGSFFLLFISVALALELSQHIGMFGGFASVSGLYLVAVIAIYLKRNALIQRAEKEIRSMIRQKKK